ncbi:arylsulfatase [Parapedobacter koreensis]|uniref:Arylsulfatase A n=1 Tax=Parapedobacter koreensis TaxID=332977 RepID=A0A1H7G2U9_9SPHI|nr:arylsulfatase [Parapedobacter koreensis]SEK32374.1 Arylsulfatase A [Parapedobacter koreensis]
MKEIIVIVVLIGASFVRCMSHQQQSARKPPNIVFILADDLGYGDLGCYGQHKIHTPYIDRLATEGMRFTQFYAGTAVCAPSRSALLTGQHTGHTYVRGNKEIQPEGQEPLADSVQTFAQLLQSVGYATGAFGKWGLGMVGTSGDPIRKGFDEFFGYNCQRQSHRYYPTHLWHNAEKVVLEGNDLSQKKHYAPAIIQEKALAFIEDNKDNPFFLFIPTVLPHAELQGPEDEHYKRYEHAFGETPYKGNGYGSDATVGGYASVSKPRATFAAMVSRLDAYVGEVLDQLDKLGLSDNTIIIFASDNGPHREGGADPQFFNSSGGLRGVKRDLYEGGIRTPFIVRWPGKVAAGSISDHLGAFWDIMPTLVEITAAPQPRYTDGLSFVPTLLGRSGQRQHPYLYWEFHEDGGRQAVRMGRWKGVRLQAKKSADAPIELYDLSTDVIERYDIADKHPDVVTLLRQAMDEAHQENSIFPFYYQGSEVY